jgi:ubiquinone/menaquinone biosynthesis C-methylase UbiE
MGAYSKYILPRLLDLAMRNSEMASLRVEWVSQARGEVLELGIGSGLNLPFYSADVQRVRGLDPSLELQRLARKRAALTNFPVEFFTQSAEVAPPIAHASIDTVVVTWTLCSVCDPVLVLRNANRVLKPEGRLIFLEHGRSPSPSVASWQDKLTPLWKHAAGGCTLNRRIDDIIRSAGFHISHLVTGYMRGPRPMTFMYKGIAQPVL